MKTRTSLTFAALLIYSTLTRLHAQGLSSIEDLQRIGNDPAFPLNGNYVLTQDIDASETALWNDAGTDETLLEGFKPIGEAGEWDGDTLSWTAGQPFTGTFDGNGFVIQGLTVSRPEQIGVGLFSRIAPGAMVRNVRLSDAALTGYYPVGSLVGLSFGTVSNASATAAVSGAAYVGGLVGRMESGTLSTCYAAGEVGGDLFSVGGLVGDIEFGTLSRCYATAAVSGESAVGGLVGSHFDQIDTCYAAGAVTGASAVGGLAGEGFGAVNKAYWDITASGQAASAGGEGRTTVQMWQQATYVGWDFVSVWGIAEGAGYPFFAVPTNTVHTLTYVAGAHGTLCGAAAQTVAYGASGSPVKAVADPGYHFVRWSGGRLDNPRTDTNVTGNVFAMATFSGVAFASGGVTVSETAGAATLTVNGGIPGYASSVKVYLQPGTATAADYTAPAGMPLTLSWAAGEIGPKTVTLPIKADSLIEDDETFYVLLGSAVNGVVDTPSVCQVTVTDANRGDTLADALDNVLLKWTTGGVPAWAPQDAVTSDGTDAASSGAMASNKVSFVQTTVTGTGTLSFAWSVASSGVLRLYDGAKVLAAVTNDTAWETGTIALTQTGTHTLKWAFTQGGDPAGRAYLDQVVWLPGVATTVSVTALASHPAGGTVSGSGSYYAGAKVPLNAKPRPGWLFTGWTPTNLFAKPLTAAQTLTVSNDAVSATAVFVKIPVVTGLPRPPEGGTVTGSGLCLPDKSVTLKATAAKGRALTRWSDGVQTASRTISATADLTLFAEFKLTSEIPPPVVANPGAQSAMVGVTFRLPLQITSESLPTVALSGLPAGLKYDAGTFTVSGVPSSAPIGGVSTVKIAASNPGGKAADTFFTLAVAPLTPSAQGTFTGVAHEEQLGVADEWVRGLFTMSVTSAGRISAKVTAQAGAYTFTGASWDTASNGVFRVLLRTTKGEELDLAVDTGSQWNTANLQATLSGGALGAAVLDVLGQRNAFLVKTAPEFALATNALARYKGYYTVALPVANLTEAPGAAQNVPQGSGYLTLTVKDGGGVSLSGKLADGTAVNGATTLLILDPDTEGEHAFVPLFFPLYAARGTFAGLLQIDPAADENSPADNTAVPAELFLQSWRYPGKTPTANPPQTEDRFALELGLAGGYYSPLTDLRAYYSNAVFSAEMTDVPYTYSNGPYTTTVDAVQAALPEVPLTFNPATGAVSLPASKAPVYNTVDGAYVYAPTNPAMATLAATQATGLFAGTFNLYYEYSDRNGALKLKTVSVSHAGVLTPVTADAGTASGQGHYLVPDTWKSPAPAPVSYPLKRSYAVDIAPGI